MKARLEPPAITLQNYGGGRLNTVRQFKAHIRRGALAHELVVQVQRHGPVPLLVGTDLQPKLGFRLLQCGPMTLQWIS